MPLRCYFHREGAVDVSFPREETLESIPSDFHHVGVPSVSTRDFAVFRQEKRWAAGMSISGMDWVSEILSISFACPLFLFPLRRGSEGFEKARLGFR